MQFHSSLMSHVEIERSQKKLQRVAKITRNYEEQPIDILRQDRNQSLNDTARLGTLNTCDKIFSHPTLRTQFIANDDKFRMFVLSREVHIYEFLTGKKTELLSKAAKQF